MGRPTNKAERVCKYGGRSLNELDESAGWHDSPTRHIHGWHDWGAKASSKLINKHSDESRDELKVRRCRFKRGGAGLRRKSHKGICAPSPPGKLHEV